MINAAVLVTSILSTSLLCYVFFCFFRNVKTGVKSRFLPDRKKTDPAKKTTGGAFSMLGGVTLSLTATSYLWGFRESLLAVWCIAFCAAMTFVGFLDDRLVDLRGENVGIKRRHRIFLTVIISLSLSAVYALMGFETMLDLPFVGRAVNTGWLFGPLFALISLVLSEGIRASGDTDGALAGQGTVFLAGIIILALLGKNPDTAKIPLLFASALLAVVFWSFPESLLKTGCADKNFLSAALISSLLATDNEGYVVIFGCFYLICLVAKPVDRAVFLVFKRHIFTGLPLDRHLKNCKYSEREIFAFYIISAVIFTAAAIALKAFAIKFQTV